jgi:hypothetical protein
LTAGEELSFINMTAGMLVGERIVSHRSYRRDPGTRLKGIVNLGLNDIACGTAADLASPAIVDLGTLARWIIRKMLGH